MTPVNFIFCPRKGFFYSVVSPHNHSKAMFPPIPSYARLRIALLITLVAGTVVTAIYLLQTKQDTLELAPYAIGFLGWFTVLAQWLVAQWRESAKATWEAVKTYYTEGDVDKFVKIREQIRRDDISGAEEFCNFYEKWGRLARLGYLPVDIFDGSSGVSISKLLNRLETHIITRRYEDNHRYAASYVWLVAEIHRRGYLRGLTKMEMDDIAHIVHKLDAG